MRTIVQRLVPPNERRRREDDVSLFQPNTREVHVTLHLPRHAYNRKPPEQFLERSRDQRRLRRQPAAVLRVLREDQERKSEKIDDRIKACQQPLHRSEARRVGKEGVSTCSTWWSR